MVTLKSTELTTGQCATLACLFEVTASKPGNVHRAADFEDLSLTDFLTGAVAIGPHMELASQRPLGETVLAAVRATRNLAQTNVNLGMILLLSPLAAVPRREPLSAGVQRILSRLTPTDAQLVYEAIRLAQPGGLGRVDEMDVAGAAPDHLVTAMAMAQERDLVARQYTNGFADVFGRVAAWLGEGHRAGWSLMTSIVHTYLRLLSAEPDSLIARKCGMKTAREASDRAAQVLSDGQPGDESYEQSLADLDFWLRSDGHRRNPGTTADLIAAGLFVVLRDETFPPPWN